MAGHQALAPWPSSSALSSAPQPVSPAVFPAPPPESLLQWNRPDYSCFPNGMGPALTCWDSFPLPVASARPVAGPLWQTLIQQEAAHMGCGEIPDPRAQCK